MPQVGKERVMARYVDIDKRYTDFIDETHGNVMTLDEILRALPPTEPDVVKVVRCKACKHHEDEEPGAVYCPDRVGGWVSEDFFCADGRRRE